MPRASCKCCRDAPTTKTRCAQPAAPFKTNCTPLRPDILGVVVAFHGDGGFTQFIYFSSEEAAREGEKAVSSDSDLGDRLRATIEGDLTFFDLKEPDFD